VLKGVTIQNCKGVGGGGIHNQGTINFNGGAITGCSATPAGAIYNDGGTVNLLSGTIMNNTATGSGFGRAAVINVPGAITDSGITESGNVPQYKHGW
jgi:hypothetical protein